MQEREIMGQQLQCKTLCVRACPGCILYQQGILIVWLHQMHHLLRLRAAGIWCWYVTDA